MHHESMHVLGVNLSHDASAALVSDGELVAAVEEERLNRMKHWDSIPVNAIRWCLEAGGLAMNDVDCVAVAGLQPFLDARVRRRLEETRAPHRGTFAEYFNRFIERELSADIRGKLRFYDHHLSHAISAYAMAGIDDALVVSLDGAGDGRSGVAYTIVGNEMNELVSVAIEDSLGFLYSDVTRYIGFGLFDEYKVMGLAPYGDPARHRGCFEQVISLRHDGGFTIDRTRLLELLSAEVAPRQPRPEESQSARDVAAALQEAFERTAMHFFAALQRRTGLRRLCYAGGVAHNCAFNGKLLASGLFDEIYVQPAADDSGLSVGAAFLAEMHEGDGWAAERRDAVFLGPQLAAASDARAIVERWPSLSVEEVSDVERVAARLLADGLALGWVQERSELGPRALGNRSILADPRPAENKARINELIKRREGFRPFAPAVIAEALGEYFEAPNEQRDFATMSFVLRVKPSKQSLLGAVTHVDGTARVQTVTRDFNPRFWRLLREFGDITGVPMLLNTSFNNHREPIVDDVNDAVACFLTTRLDVLVVGDLVVRRRRQEMDWLADMYVRRRRLTSLLRDERGYLSAPRHPSLKAQVISRELFLVLVDADGSTTLTELAQRARIEMGVELLAEVHHLWTERHVDVAPSPARGDALWRAPSDEEWF